MSKFLEALRTWWSRDPLHEEAEKFCARLRAMGIDAQMLKVGDGGLISIKGELIKEIRIRVEQSGDYESNVCHYIVRDPRLFVKLYQFTIYTVHVRTFWGRVVDLRWEGSDCGTGVIDQLQSDMLIKRAIMKIGDIYIDARKGEWWITPEYKSAISPSEEQWNCYQAIARRLLTLRPYPQ
jgi:hypothetical protein